ncbi:hypothetical protein ACP8H3_08870 [Bacillus velezensis]|uniref:hypothetical protein n=1 Tax=Bacillus velezensis TaxID=492670 RepID=UPI003CF95C2E
MKKNEDKKTAESKLTLEDIPKGEMLEYRIKRLLFHMGYFPTKGVYIKTSFDEYQDDITDLDVYGVYIHKDFRRKTIWVDCKSGKAKPMERIAWMKGIKQLVNADDIIFVKNGIRKSVKVFARNSDIQILDLSMLRKLEESYGIDEDNWIGAWNPINMFNKRKQLSNLKIPQIDIYKKIVRLISAEYWSMDSYTQLKKIITALRTLSAVPIESLNKEDAKALKYGVYTLTNLFTLTTLNICRDLYFFNPNDKRELLLDALLSSGMPLKKRNEILQATYRLAYEIIRTKLPDTPDIVDKELKISPPDYFDAFEDLINRVVSNPVTYFDILRSLDLVLMEFDLNEKEIDRELIEKHCENYNLNILGIKTILQFICQITHIDKSFFQLLK